MKILVTGAHGFIAQNLIYTLQQSRQYEVLEYHYSMGEGRLRLLSSVCDIVFHLAGVNRPISDEEFGLGNIGFTQTLINILEEECNQCPIVFSSSIQATFDNPYGKSKLACEELLIKHAQKTGASVAIYRLPNVFGKWCRPNYNSVVATFCHQISHGLPIHIRDSSYTLNLVYIDDVVKAFLSIISELNNGGTRECFVEPIYSCTLGELASKLKEFSRCRESINVPNQNDEFTKKLYSTYLSYLPSENFSYDLNTHADSRGSFTEFIRTDGQGQFSVNIAHPNIVKGNHWHNNKHEKFFVVAGEGVIRFRKKGSDIVICYEVSGKDHKVVEIPPGYVHNIENTGESDMVTVMWANEIFDPQYPDTFAEEV